MIRTHIRPATGPSLQGSPRASRLTARAGSRVFLAAALVAGLAVSALPGQAISQAAGGQPLVQTNMPPNTYLQAAVGITNAIDRYEMAAVWASASPVMKTNVPEERFIANIAQRRALLGTIASREWVSIMRVPMQQGEGSLPAGNYVSVRFGTAGTNGRLMEEVISFHLDTDNQWRLVGYSLN